MTPLAHACDLREGNTMRSSADKRDIPAREFELEAIMQLIRFRGRVLSGSLTGKRCVVPWRYTLVNLLIPPEAVQRK